MEYSRFHDPIVFIEQTCKNGGDSQTGKIREDFLDGSGDLRSMDVNPLGSGVEQCSKPENQM